MNTDSGDKSQFVGSGSANGLTGAGFSIPRQNLNSFTSKFVSGAGIEASSAVPAALYEKYDKPQERYVWEMRKRSPNTTPASTVLNSPDLTDPLGYSMQLHQHQQIRVGRSPVSLLETTNETNPPTNRTTNNLLSGNSEIVENNIPQQMLTSAGSPTDLGTSGSTLIRGGEIVVFDDIDTNWMKSNKDCCMSSEDVLKVTKMIGQLPIAEYEGSPRRIGSFHQQETSPYKTYNSNINSLCGNNPRSPSLFPRLPGFPQRISPNSGSDERNQSPNLIDIDASDDNSSEKATNNKSSLNLSVVTTNSANNKDNKDEEESIKPKTPTFDYLYEFSETRKVLEEFFKCTNNDDERKFSDLNESDDLASTDTNQDYNNRSEEKKAEQAYIGQRLARIPNEEYMVHRSPRKQKYENFTENNDIELYIDTNSRSSGDIADTELEANLRRHSRNFTLSPETTDYDSNCGDLDSLSNDINCQTDFGKLYTSMPVLEDGLSSGHASDTENNLSSAVIEKNYLEMAPVENMDKNNLRKTTNDSANLINITNNLTTVGSTNPISTSTTAIITSTTNSNSIVELTSNNCTNLTLTNNINNCKNIKENNFDAIFSSALMQSTPPPPPAPAPHRHATSGSIIQSIPSNSSNPDMNDSQDIQEALKDIRSALQRTKALQESKSKYCDEVLQGGHESPVWIPRQNSSQENLSSLSNLQLDSNKKDSSTTGNGHDEDEADTDLETDRLLGQQRSDEHDFFDEKPWLKASHLKSPTNLSGITLTTIGSSATGMSTGTANAIVKPQTFSSATIRQGIGTALTPTSPDHLHMVDSSEITITSPEKLQFTKTSPTSSIKSKKDSLNGDKKSKSRNKEALLDPAVLIEGVLFRARYLGSTQLVCEGQPTKSTRMMQAEEAVSRIKAPEGENQPSTEVDLFISTEKIMVLNTDLKEIMMDHALRTISYIADIGDLVVLMARRRFVPSDSDENVKPNRTPKMICHVFESDEAQFIAQSIGQAFQVAYMEFLKANGIEDHSFVKEMDYQEVLNSQEIFGDELEIFAKKELQKEVVVPKAKGEILGVVIVESGWGSMLPTVVIANLMSSGAAARCGQLNIGDQLIAINGMSLVGLPLSTCQTYIRNTKTQTAVKFTVVPCPPVVEVKIKRPNTKYQLGFSVQNGVICSLLRGGIAERGGVRVGHRIIEINNQSVVAVPHEKIVNLLATSVGEILMKTMPTSMFRLLTGQENPIYI